MKIDVQAYDAELTQIAATAVAALQVTNHESLQRIASQVERDLLAHRTSDAIRLAFVGQFSAGKSTIISALTGRRDIGIDADIATDRTTDYPWGDGLVLVDTPGLYTERPEHDAITREAIRRADLLIYCITSSLFDEVVAANFRKLAFEDGYAPKMMLVVNKMSAEAGSRDELIANYEKSLGSAIAPHELSSFPRVFIDAKDFIDGVDENAPDLVEESHIADLEHALNALARDQGVLGKLDAPLRMIVGAVDEAEVHAVPAAGIDDGYLLTLDQLSRTTRTHRHDFRSKIAGMTADLAHELVALGRDVASRVGDGSDIESALALAQTRVATRVEAMTKTAIEVADASADTVQSDIAKVLDGVVVEAMFSEVHARDINTPPSFGAPVDFDARRMRFANLRSIGGSVAEHLAKAATGPSGRAGGSLLRASSVAGSQLHHAVYGIGKFVGYNFRPHQAVNIAKNAGNVAKVVGPLLALAGPVLDLHATYAEKREEERLAQARGEVRGSFLASAREIEREFETKFRDEFERSVFDVVDDRITAARSAFEAETAATSALVETLRGVRADARRLLTALRGSSASSIVAPG